MHLTPAQSARLDHLTSLYLRCVRGHLDDSSCVRAFFRGMLQSGLADELLHLTPAELAAAAVRRR